MYNSNSDPPNQEQQGHNAWSVLSNTEQWISSTLASSNADAESNPGGPSNPYARKEVSYVCENQSTSSMVVSSIFRFLKEAREQGEAHGEGETERAAQQGELLYIYI